MLKKHLLKFIFLLFITKSIFSQTVVRGSFNFPSEEYEIILLDNTIQNIYYQYTFVKNSKKKEKTSSSLTILQIGKIFSKFTDFSLLKNDSLKKKFSNLKSIGSKEMNQILATYSNVGFNKSLIRNKQTKKISFQAKVHSDKYEYEIESPKFNWKIKDETKSILNYKTQKATVNFGGRNWVAWFTKDIPINLGPYVFSDLPGLILELYDIDKNFHFIAIGMDNKHNKIYKRNEKRIIKTTKKSFFKTKKSFYERPELFIKGVYKGVSVKKLPYNPIEIN